MDVSDSNLQKKGCVIPAGSTAMNINQLNFQTINGSLSFTHYR